MCSLVNSVHSILFIDIYFIKYKKVLLKHIEVIIKIIHLTDSVVEGKTEKNIVKI